MGGGIFAVFAKIPPPAPPRPSTRCAHRAYHACYPSMEPHGLCRRYFRSLGMHVVAMGGR